jgi:hypothetical protein
MRCAKLHVPPSFAIAKVKNIASNLSIPKSNFKASWQWLSQFRVCRGLQEMLLHEKGTEVNKNDPKLLVALEEFTRLLRNMIQKMSTIWTKLACFFKCF